MRASCSASSNDDGNIVSFFTRLRARVLTLLYGVTTSGECRYFFAVDEIGFGTFTALRAEDSGCHKRSLLHSVRTILRPVD